MSSAERTPKDEREQQKLFDRLERASRGPSVVTSEEERRLYELNRQGIEAPIQTRPIRRHCANDQRHKAHEWTASDQSARYHCEGWR